MTPETQKEIGENALDALILAPIKRLNESDTEFIERYKQWFRGARYEVIQKWREECDNVKTEIKC